VEDISFAEQTSELATDPEGVEFHCDRLPHAQVIVIGNGAIANTAITGTKGID
jgi:hypothetical protein